MIPLYSRHNCSQNAVSKYVRRLESPQKATRFTLENPAELETVENGAHNRGIYKPVSEGAEVKGCRDLWS